MSNENRRQIEALIEKYEKTVYKLAYSCLRSRQDADDIYQEVFLRYFRRQPEFTSEEHEKAWFIRTTINCCKNFCVSSWFRRTAPLEEGALGEEAVYVPEEQSELFAAVMALPAKYRTVIHLFYYEGYSVREIAELTGEKVTTVTTRLNRARTKLRDALTEAEPVCARLQGTVAGKNQISQENRRSMHEYKRI